MWLTNVAMVRAKPLNHARDRPTSAKAILSPTTTSFRLADKRDTEHLVHRVLNPEPRAGETLSASFASVRGPEPAFSRLNFCAEYTGSAPDLLRRARI
jgi:hypothetical protein